jgi:hypothetical protein
VLNERSNRKVGPGSRDTLGLLEGDEGSPFRRMDPAEGAELSLLGWTHIAKREPRRRQARWGRPRESWLLDYQDSRRHAAEQRYELAPLHS